MWIIHWFESEAETPTSLQPDTYENFQYLGPRTFLTLPEETNVGQQTIQLQNKGTYALPPAFGWVVRSIEEGRLISVT